VDAYLNLHKTSVRVKEFGVTHMAWTVEAYEAYSAEAKKYLGTTADDPLISGRLIVWLYKATMDKREKIKK